MRSNTQITIEMQRWNQDHPQCHRSVLTHFSYGNGKGKEGGVSKYIVYQLYTPLPPSSKTNIMN